MTDRRDHLQTLTNLDAKVNALRQTSTYPDQPQDVEAVETHKSWVFLTNDYAYKLKKPIRFDSVDHRTLEARRDNCHEEVRLNRRLAPDVYLGSVPLTMATDGNIQVQGDGEVIDWLVQMRRLPTDRMLDALIERGAVGEREIRLLARRLSAFYRNALKVDMGGEVYRAAIERELNLNRDAFSDEIELRIGMDARLIVDRCRELLEDHRELLDQRARDGHIVEGHGDLRPEHVCFLNSEPVVIDCLEFDRQLRTVDPVDEIGFLDMECERLGAAWIGTLLFQEYRRLTGDDPPDQLIRFYKTYRATTWARLAAWRLREENVQEPEKWISRARTLLQLAEHYASGAIRAVDG